MLYDRPPLPHHRTRSLLIRVLVLLLLGLGVYFVSSLLGPFGFQSQDLVLGGMGLTWLLSLAALRRTERADVVRALAILTVLQAHLATLWLLLLTGFTPIGVGAMAVAVVLAGLLLEARGVEVGVAVVSAMGLLATQLHGLITPTLEIPVLLQALSNGLHLIVIATMLLWASRGLRRSLLAQESSRLSYMALFSNSPDGILVLDEQLTILALNPSAEQILSRRATELTGLDFRQAGLLPPEELDVALDALRDTLRSNSPMILELEFLATDQSQTLVECSLQASPGPDGRLLVLATLRDIIARRQLEQLQIELDHEQQRALRTEALTRMARGTAHDINNLLTIIIGSSSLLLENPELDAASRAAQRDILEAGRKAAAITRQLLTFSRRQVVAPKIIDLNVALSEAHRVLTQLLSEDITLSISLASEPCLLRIDPGQLEQVVVNLVINAGDAMPNGGHLTVATRILGEEVELEVTDTGEGMDANTQLHIFEPFFTTKSQGKGTGLGLSTVSGIVEQSRGSIQLHSAPDQGTTFLLRFPRVQDADPHPSPAPLPHEGSMTILLVEDEEQIRELARRVLTGAGYTVLEASDLAGALRVYTEHTDEIALLFTDVVLPDGSGADLSRRLPRLPAIFTSGRPDERALRDLDASRFLPKPYTPEDLLTEVRGVLPR